MRETLHPLGNLDRVHVRTYSPNHSKKKKKSASFPNTTDTSTCQSTFGKEFLPGP